MGIYCAKLCLPDIPDPGRNVREKLRRRFENLRDDSSVMFKEGFVLGVHVRKLQQLLESLDTPDDRRIERAPDVLAEKAEAVELRVNEQSVSVQVDAAAAVKIQDDAPQVARKFVPHSLVDVIKKDFQPWLRVDSGSRASVR